jgi:hypothetical protein
MRCGGPGGAADDGKGDFLMGVTSGVGDGPYRVRKPRIMDTGGVVPLSGLGGAVHDVRGGNPDRERAGWSRLGRGGTEVEASEVVTNDFKYIITFHF